MSSKGKFITILIISLLTLLGVLGLVVLNLDTLREWHDVEEEPPVVNVEVEDNTEEDIEEPVGEKFNMYLFWGDGCVHCHNLKIFLNDLEPKYKEPYSLPVSLIKYKVSLSGCVNASYAFGVPRKNLT